MLIFEEIDQNSKNHINATFEILVNRKFNISNIENTSYEEHLYFVKNNPYRKWYLIKNKSNYIGTLYISNHNIIGINILNSNDMFLRNIYNFAITSHKPLPEIKSVRTKYFCINVNPDNKTLINFLESTGALHVQNTYRIY